MEDDEYKGYRIPAGTIVFPNIWYVTNFRYYPTTYLIAVCPNAGRCRRTRRCIPIPIDFIQNDGCILKATSFVQKNMHSDLEEGAVFLKTDSFRSRRPNFYQDMCWEPLCIERCEFFDRHTYFSYLYSYCCLLRDL